MSDNQPLVGMVMGSTSDWDGVMKEGAKVLRDLGIPFDVQVISAHRNSERLEGWVKGAEARGIEVIIAGAGKAAALPGVCAAYTHLPVLGVPVKTSLMGGLDSLLSIVQMPSGVPVGTLAVGATGAKNAAILAASILALNHADVKEALLAFRKAQSERQATVSLDD